MNTKHTPTPWFHSNHSILAGEGDERHTVAGTHQALYNDKKEADAAFIVEAVNAHEGLVRERDEAVHFCSQLSKDLAQNDDNYKTVVNLISDERDVLRKFYFAFKHQKGECWCVDGTCLIHECERSVQNFYNKGDK